MNKEQIYDTEIAPLMTKIIDVCRTHKIGMLASYAIPTSDDDGLYCTTSLFDDSGKVPERFQKPLSLILAERASTPLMITTTKRDGSKTITAIFVKGCQQ